MTINTTSIIVGGLVLVGGIFFWITTKDFEKIEDKADFILHYTSNNKIQS